MQKGRRATARALKEAKKILKRDGERKRKWTVVLITFGAPRIGRKRTYVVSQRLKKAGADMYVLGVGRRAFRNYESLKRIVRPFEATKRKTLHRLFLFRGPQNRQNFILTKTVLKIGMSHYIEYMITLSRREGAMGWQGFDICTSVLYFISSYMLII